MKQKDETILRYKEKIILFSPDKEKTYFLAGKSVHNPSAYFLLENRRLQGIEHFFSGATEMIFEFTPKLYFEAAQNLANLENFDPKRDMYTKRKKVEDKLNKTILENSVGKPVKLGDQIQLYHPATGLYLRISSTKSYSGDFNILTLDSKISPRCQFEIKSRFAFKKNGSFVFMADDFYLKNDKKTLVYPTLNPLIKKSSIQFIDGRAGDSFANRYKTKELRLPDQTELQSMARPIQAGNILMKNFDKRFSNKFKAIKANINFDNTNEVFDSNYRWGDYLMLSKLDQSGLGNSLFCHCNNSGLTDVPLIKFVMESKYKDLKGYESIFQIFPKKPEMLGKPICFDDENEVRVYLKHYITGKFLYFSREEEIFKLAEDYGVFYDYVDGKKSSRQSSYRKSYSEYQKIMKDESIKDKEAVAKAKFPPSMIRLFESTDRIIETEDRYDDQYLREICFYLVKMSKGETKNLQNSSYFSIRTYEGIYIKVQKSQTKLENLIKDKASEVNDSYFEKTFNIEDFYELHFCIGTKDKKQADFFYLEQPKDLDYNPKRIDYCIADLTRYFLNTDTDGTNLSTATIALEFLKNELKQPFMTKLEFQNYLRESCTVDLLMKILIKIFLSDLEKNKGKMISVFNKAVSILDIFVENNDFSALYCYQWKDFFSVFLQHPRILRGKTTLNFFISKVFERTGNYKQYLEYNLKPICKAIDFKNYDRQKLRQFLSMLQTCIKMKNPLIDEYIIKTVVFSENKDRIFYPFTVDEDGFAQVQVSKGITLTMNKSFCISQEVELNYIIDLVSAAAILIEIAPTRVSDKMKESFPKKVCLTIIKNIWLDGKLRGAFITVYKSLHIMAELPKLEIIIAETNIVVPIESTPYRGIQRSKTSDLRKSVLKTETADVVQIILDRNKYDDDGLMSAVMDLSYFILQNHLLNDEEVDKLEENLKWILKAKGVPQLMNSHTRQVSNKQTLKTLRDISLQFDIKIKVSILQEKDWMPNLINCLIEIEKIKNQKIFDKFALEEAVSLRVDYINIRKKFSDPFAENRKKLMNADRKKLKKYMDDKTNSDLETPNILIGLINPEKRELSTKVFKYLNLLLKRDELTLENYSHKFVVQKKIDATIKKDFIEFFELGYKTVGESLKLTKAIQEKEKSKVVPIFAKLMRKINEINQKIYRAVKEGDAKKKIETSYEMYTNKDIFIDFTLQMKDDLSINPKEKAFYFNILNRYLGNTTHYKFRKTVFIDLNLPRFILNSLKEISYFMKIYDVDDLGSSDGMDEMKETLHIDEGLIQGGSLNEDFKKALVQVFLLLDYIFVIPCTYNTTFIKQNLEVLIEILQLIFSKGGRNLKLFAMKFLALLIKDNMSVLAKINRKLIHLLFSNFKRSLSEKDYQISYAFLELFQILIEFRGVSFIENSYIISSEILNAINSRNSTLRTILEKRLKDLLKSKRASKLETNLDYSEFRWDTLQSEEKNQISLTREHALKFKGSKFLPEVLISLKIFNLFKAVLSVNQAALTELIKNTFSLGYLLEISQLAQDWWPMKSSVLSLITSLYVNEKLSEMNFDILATNMEKNILKDISEFESNNKRIGLENSEFLYSDIISISSHNLEESVYKPFFGVIAFNKSESLKDYIVNKVSDLMFELFTTLKGSHFLSFKDITVIKSFKKHYRGANERRNIFAHYQSRKALLDSDDSEKNLNDRFYARFRDDDNKGKQELHMKNELMNEAKAEMNEYKNSYISEMLEDKMKKYVHNIELEFNEEGSGKEDMFLNKRELLNKNFLKSINDEDYKVFIDSVIKNQNKSKMKWYIFLSDLVRLLKPRGITFVRIERIINILEKIVERSSDPLRTIKILANLGLFANIVEKYTENRYDIDICMILAKFLILCTSLGLHIVQESVLKSLYYDMSNSFINSIKENLNQSFEKFYQRELLRNTFIGRELMDRQLQEDLNGPIEEASEVYMTHLEMLRYFCEGHFSKMQNYFRTQLDEGKYKPNQVNFLVEIEKQLKLYSGVLSIRNTKVGMKILEFLVEMIQGPCRANQIEISNLKIIETLEEISTTLIYDMYNIEEKVKSGLINQIILILLGSLESNYIKLIISKVALNTNTEAYWERLVQIQALLNGSFSRYSNPILDKFRMASKAANKLMKESIKKAKKSRKKKKKLLNMEKSKNKELNAISKNANKRYQIYEKGGFEYSQLCQEGINISILFKLLMSFGDEYSHSIEKEYSLKTEGHNKDLALKTRRFFFSKIKSIEIVNQEGELERVYYSLPAIARFHSNFSKSDFEQNVDRKSSNTKLTGLVNIVPYTLYELKYFAWLSKKGLMANLSIVRVLRYINFIWAFVVNFMMLIFPHPDINDESDGRIEFSLLNFEFQKWLDLNGVSKVLFAMNVLLLTSHIFTLVFWLILEFSLERHKIILDETMKKQKKMLAEADNTMNINIKSGEEDSNKKVVESKGEKKVKISFFLVLWRIFTETYIFFMLTMIVCCLLGLTFSKLFLSFLLLDIVTLSIDLQNVMKAITMRIKSLSITYWFGIILLFMFSSLTYYSQLGEKLVFIDDDNFEMCHNFVHCVIMTINFGMRSGGGIGEALLYPHYYTDTENYLIRTMFDLTFFVLINLILLEIVFGLIVDSFGELREIRNVNLNDVNSKCFICNIHSDVFSKRNLGFNIHREQDHNHWNYIYYVVGLLLKDKEDMNGLESYILGKYLSKEKNWLPVGRALAIKKLNLREDIDQRIEGINGKVSEMEKSLRELGVDFSRFDESEIQLIEGNNN